MGNILDHQDRWQTLSLTRTALPDVNSFLEEIRVFNDKVNHIRDALLHSEQSLILYLGLEDIETFQHDVYSDS